MSVEYLTEDETVQLFNDLDTTHDEQVSFSEIEAKLIAVTDEFYSEAHPHLLHHSSHRMQAGDLHAFIYSLLPQGKTSISRADFIEHVRSWRIPSLKAQEEREHEPALPLARRVRALWLVKGPSLLFLGCVVLLQVGIGVWKMVTFLDAKYQAAFGWGVAVAKACAGALYPTMFLLILSMSRHLATLLRRHRLGSRFINWDISQAFHVRLSCVALVLASLHSISHLSGTFVFGSQPERQAALAIIIGPDAVPKSYVAFVRSTPGWTGLVALGLFYLLACTSIPWIRSRYYEVFQLGHLLLFPIIGLLCAHGTAALLQSPTLGYCLALPALLVVLERVHRLIRGLIPIEASLDLLDDNTIAVTCEEPKGRPWNYRAGQYILLQVPDISHFQWHPFTVSACIGNKMQVHIKVAGDWTAQLAELHRARTKIVHEDGQDTCKVKVGIDGPFGAPAQSFYRFDRSIIIGAGIGITPFSGILTDLDQNYLCHGDPWKLSSRRRSMKNGKMSRTVSLRGVTDVNKVPGSGKETPSLPVGEEKASGTPIEHPQRRVDFHWIVGQREQLFWFSDLLNRAVDMADKTVLDLRLHTHVTTKKQLTAHVFRCLLDRFRTEEHPYSALTGLKVQSQFGRPDLSTILEDYHADMLRQGWKGGKVGVFCCANAAISNALADKCATLTAKALKDRSFIKYMFISEVF